MSAMTTDDNDDSGVAASTDQPTTQKLRGGAAVKAKRQAALDEAWREICADRAARETGEAERRLAAEARHHANQQAHEAGEPLPYPRPPRPQTKARWLVEWERREAEEAAAKAERKAYATAYQAYDRKRKAGLPAEKPLTPGERKRAAAEVKRQAFLANIKELANRTREG